MKNQLLLLLFFFSFLKGFSQSSSPFEVGIGMGPSFYQGDISPNLLGSVQKPGFSFGVSGSWGLLSFLSLRGAFAHATIKEDESTYRYSYHQFRNFSFQTTINELSAQVVLNPRNNNGQEEPGNLTPYFSAGVGVSFLRIQRNWSLFNYEYYQQQQWVIDGLIKDSSTAMPASVVSIPLGAGLRYFFGENVSLYAEAVHRVTGTGYLDGFSLAANPKRNDAFTTLNVGVVFRFSSGGSGRGGYGCPVNIY